MRPSSASGKGAHSGGEGDDRLRVLRMVQQGRLTPEEALLLLEALDEPRSPADGGGARRGRVLRIRVFDGGEDRVRLNIPLGLARSALRLIPRSATRYLEGIDLHALLDQVERGAQGKILEVLDDGDTGVEITVE